MINNNFIKVCCITPDLEVGNPKFNAKEILRLINDNQSSVCVLPELSITGYTCGDLFYQNALLEDTKEAVLSLVKNNKYKGLLVIGAPIEMKGSLFNCAIAIKDNKIIGIVPKRSLPNSKEYYEKRWFKSSANEFRKSINYLGQEIPFGNLIFSDNSHNLHVGIEICEDMWSTVSPGNILSLNGCNVILNLSASNETLGKNLIRRNSVLENSRRNCGAYIYASSGVNESSSDTVFSGHNIIACCGELISETENFSIESEEVYADIDLSMINYKRLTNTNFHDNIHIDFEYKIIDFKLNDSGEYNFINKPNNEPFVPKENCEEAFYKISALQEYALFKRLKHTKAKTLVIGVSGGLDSTLALLVAVEAFKKLNYELKNIIAVTMPGLGTSERTKNNALQMMSSLGVTLKEIPITDACLRHFKEIGQDPNNHDVTYENTQARYRTMLLMDIANKENGLVLGTGDMSELALGWCTYNGDQMSMYGINAGIPKTLVRFMVKNYAVYKFTNIKDTLLDVCDTPISPELSSSSQKTEDLVGKYEVNDFILYRYLACGDSEDRIKFLLPYAFDLSKDELNSYVDKFFIRFFTQQFKRQALPDGPKVLDISLGSRSDYRMPSDIKRW